LLAAVVVLGLEGVVSVVCSVVFPNVSNHSSETLQDLLPYLNNVCTLQRSGWSLANAEIDQKVTRRDF